MAEMVTEDTQNAGTTVKTPEQVETLRAIRQDIGRRYDEHGGQLHLRDLLREAYEASAPPEVTLKLLGDHATLGFGPSSLQVQVLKEERTGKKFVVAPVPVCFLTADQTVNPRHLQRTRLERLVEAFRGGHTRFQLTQCRLLPRGSDRYEVAVFDGSHGTAAEMLTGAREITCKIFLPGELSDREAFEWNTEAHSTLRQQEFRSRVLMSKRSKIFYDTFEQFLRDTRHADTPKSESGWISTLPVYQRRSMVDSIMDYVYYAVLEDEHEVEFADPTTGEMRTSVAPSCKLQAFVRKDEQQQRGGKSLGYDLLKGTIFKEFVQQDASTRAVDKLAREDWPRERERRNLVRLCNILADETLAERWGQTRDVWTDPESEATSGRRRRKHTELTAEAILSANIWKKGAVRLWAKRLRDAIGLMLGLASGDLDSIFQRDIEESTWKMIRDAIERIWTYGAWTSDRVVPLLGGNVIGEIERAIDEWAEYSNQRRLDAYYLAGKERP